MHTKTQNNTNSNEYDGIKRNATMKESSVQY